MRSPPRGGRASYALCASAPGARSCLSPTEVGCTSPDTLHASSRRRLPRGRRVSVAAAFTRAAPVPGTAPSARPLLGPRVGCASSGCNVSRRAAGRRRVGRRHRRGGGSDVGDARAAGRAATMPMLAPLAAAGRCTTRWARCREPLSRSSCCGRVHVTHAERLSGRLSLNAPRATRPCRRSSRSPRRACVTHGAVRASVAQGESCERGWRVWCSAGAASPAAALLAASPAAAAMWTRGGRCQRASLGGSRAGRAAIVLCSPHTRRRGVLRAWC